MRRADSRYGVTRTTYPRRRFLQAAGAASAGALMTQSAKQGLAAPAVVGSSPNFLFIICDQLGLDAIAAHGCDYVETPHLDRLAAGGTTFIESHSTNPVCSPARSSLMTGRMPVETGVISNGRPIHSSCPTIGHCLSSHGYESAYCGKWHLPGPVPKPQDGFRVLPARGGLADHDDCCISHTCEAFLKNRANSKTPFLLVASFLQPHDICFWGNHAGERMPETLPFPELEEAELPPLPPNLRVRPEAPAKLASRFVEYSDIMWRYYLYVYSRMIEMLDADVGRLLDALESTDLDKNTVVVFTSDHGDGRGRHSHVAKWYPYEEAVKVPLIVSWKDHIAANHRDTEHLVSGVDIVPTLCDYAGVAPPAHVQGRSLRPLAEGGNTSWRDFVYFEVMQTGRVIRSDRWKYVRFSDDPVEQLFDMREDPWETKNLYRDPRYADVLADHRRMLDEYTATLRPVEPTVSTEKPAKPPKKAPPKPRRVRS
ncbi:sulfatase family protein [Thermostilla marina]